MSIYISSCRVLPTRLPATRGIGAACAKALAEAGASVCLVLRAPAEGAQPNLDTVGAIRAMGVRAEYVYCDLSDLNAVKGLFQKALDAMGGQIHVLVNCAGIQRRSPSVDFSERDWDDVCTLFYPYSSPNPSPCPHSHGPSDTRPSILVSWPGMPIGLVRPLAGALFSFLL